MVELTWYQNNNSKSEQYKKWYVRPVMRQMLGIHEMAQHMAEHNTPFSAGTIEGILTDFSRCIREQLLNGNSVKIDDLAIFKITIHSNSFDTIAGIDYKTGKLEAVPKVGSAVKRTRLLASATGDMTSLQLNWSTKFGWDKGSQALIDEAKKKAQEDIARLEQLGEQVEQQMKEEQAEGADANADMKDGEDAVKADANADNAVDNGQEQA